MSNINTNSHLLKFGYIPPSFPRDPMEVNQFLEHMVLGQILEPLVEVDENGAIVDGVADSWSFSKDGLKINFQIKHNLFFSNKKPVTARDAAYTIRRNLDHSSQSSGFLEAIKNVAVVNDHSLDVFLKYADTAVVKALSRDQLGVIPDNWHFDPKSDEPLIGTGHYRLIRRDDTWRLEANEMNRHHAEIKEKLWQLVFFANDSSDLPANIVPDVAPLLTKTILDRLKKHPAYKADEFGVTPALSFFQTSIWIHPAGKSYSDSIRRRMLCYILRRYVQDKVNMSSLKEAHGMIPIGIAGYLPKPLDIASFKANVHPAKERTKFQIAIVPGVFEELNSAPEMKMLLQSLNAELELIPYTPPKIKEFFSQHSPDAFTGSWAGGYNDPTGFIGLLFQMVRQEFSRYIGADLGPVYVKAKQERNWSQRAELFRRLDEAVQRDCLMVPGWSVPQYQVIRKDIKAFNEVFRYTPRLINFHR